MDPAMDEVTPEANEIGENVLPLGADGNPLNLDFETGTLKDWTVDGEAFRGQPINGDKVARRRSDMKSRHQGDYWIGGFELKGDRPQGTLTSVPFKVTHPWASFLIGGGPYSTTCVELILKDTGELLSRTSGSSKEDLRRVSIDLRRSVGKEIFIRLVDRHSGGWGHINFDDFRFHRREPDTVRDVAKPAKKAEEEKKRRLKEEAKEPRARENAQPELRDNGAEKSAASTLKFAKSLHFASLDAVGEESVRLEREYIKSLHQIIEKHPMTKAAKEAKELLDKRDR